MQKTKKFEAPISLNAAIFASVLLSSRLESDVHVFAILSFAIELFALFPIMCHYLKAQSTLLSIVMTTCLFVGTSYQLVQISTLIGSVFILAILFITFACPYWLKWIQRYKNEIHGPWDEAVPTRSGAVFKG